MTIATGTADTGPPPAPRKRGRPVTTGGTPQRNAGRHGKIWDDCVAQAEANGETMTDFVRRAITAELGRSRASAHRTHAGLGIDCVPCGGPCTIDATLTVQSVTPGLGIEAGDRGIPEPTE